jgi:hypothetical protein
VSLEVTCKESKIKDLTKWCLILSPGTEESWKTGGKMVVPVVNIGSAQTAL